VALTQIRNILARDGWTLRDNEARRGSRRISFFFGSRATSSLTKSFRAIARVDKNRFRHIGVLVAPTTAQMNRLRDSRHAGKFPRALFTSIEELETTGAVLPVSSAASFDANIVANTPVGDAPHVHYRLVFDAPEMGDILPPQFFMMDVLPKRTPLGDRAVRRAGWRDAVDWTPQPLLKRPFGLCRAYLPHFPSDYLKRLALPAGLTLSLHTPKANRFDMLYKVLPDGVGTPLMTKLRRGDKVHMVGPLGRAFDVRTLRAAGVEEVHVVGGGVGVAPLILLVEALRFYGFRVKVFLGMATLESLRYRDELAAAFGEKSRDAYVYIDDLLAAGVASSDIFVSCDRERPRNVRRIPAENLFHGLVPEQYRRYLRRGALHAPNVVSEKGCTQCAPTKTIAFTCGPNRMMEVMTEICRQAGVPLKVLLEKRMGCGFGVCFSCVQKVRRADGTDDYARVCKEGPIFDAKDILWNNDSKPNLEACGCKARC
jgi:dihydroorotate dehydrogenase electron transfer subunit